MPKPIDLIERYNAAAARLRFDGREERRDGPGGGLEEAVERLGVGPLSGLLYAFGASVHAGNLVIYLGFPGAFAETDEERAQIRGMVWLHVATLAVFLVLWYLAAPQGPTSSSLR